MRLFITLSLLIAITTNSKAQVSYMVSPAKTVSVTATYNQTTVSDIYQVNTAASKIVLKWERVLVNLPVGWTPSICDFGTCYGTVPAMSTMDSIPVGGQGLLGLNIDPGTIAGSGVVKVYVYQNGYYSNGDTITWNITSAPVSLEELSFNDGITVYPTLAKDLLNINFKTASHENIKAYVIDALGQKIVDVYLTEQTNQVDISQLSSGFYNLMLESDSKIVFKRIIKTE